MIIINTTGHIVNHDGAMILPGSNVVEKFDDKHEAIQDMVDNGELKIIREVSKASKADKAEALRHAPDAKTLAKLDELFKASEDTVLSKASKARKKEMDDFENEIEQAKNNKSTQEEA